MTQDKDKAYEMYISLDMKNNRKKNPEKRQMWTKIDDIA